MRVVVVVSAMSGVTNRLIDAARRAGEGDTESAQRSSKRCASNIAPRLPRSCPIKPTAGRRPSLDAIFAEGKRLYDGTAMLREADATDARRHFQSGERLCAPIFAGALRQLGAKSRSIEATELIVTDSYHGGAEPRADETRQKSSAVVAPLLEAGETRWSRAFIGATHDGRLTTLGRGGSDYSATILGAALDADDHHMDGRRRRIDRRPASRPRRANDSRNFLSRSRPSSLTLAQKSPSQNVTPRSAGRNPRLDSQQLFAGKAWHKNNAKREEHCGGVKA